MELKLGHTTILKRLEHSACSLKDFTHASQEVGNQGYHYAKYLSDLENWGYVLLIGDYYRITGFGIAKLEEKRSMGRPIATKIATGTTKELYDGADLKQGGIREGAFDFLKYPSKFGDNLIFPRVFV
jgi:hypothetical protein